MGGTRRIPDHRRENADETPIGAMQPGGVSSIKSSHSALSRARASALLLAPTTQAALIDPIDTPLNGLHREQTADVS